MCSWGLPVYMAPWLDKMANAKCQCCQNAHANAAAAGAAYGKCTVSEPIATLFRLTRLEACLYCTVLVARNSTTAVPCWTTVT